MVAGAMGGRGQQGGPSPWRSALPSLDMDNPMSEESIIGLFGVLKQIHAAALELLDHPDLPEQAKKGVLLIIEGAETALNAQNKEPRDISED